MLRGCARLAEKHGLFIQTHINENEREIELVRRLFPDSDSYMRIYDAAGLLTRRTLLAHNIHAGDDELALCEERRSAVVHCPDSNLFLESGRFPIEIYEDRSIPLGLGCDVGAGSTVSMFHTMRAAEKVQQRTLDPLHLLFLATLGGAEVVSMGYETGNFAAGKSFDAVALSIDGILPDRKMEELSPGLVASAIVREGNRSNVRRLFIRGREAIASGG
jgi:guanine deaminase